MKPRALLPRMTGCCRAAGVLLLAVSLGTDVEAGSGRVDVLPTNPRNARHGVQLRVDTRWVDCNGYRPIRVELSTIPPQPAIAERQFRIELSHSGYWRGRERKVMDVRDILVLGEGQATVSKTILLPQWNNLPHLDVRLYEGGNELREFSERLATIGAMGSSSWTEASPAILLVSSAAPPWRQRRVFDLTTYNDTQSFTLPQVVELHKSLPTSPNYMTRFTSTPPMSDDAQLNFLAQVPRFEVISPVDLPDQWLALSGVDLLFISWPDLQSLATSRPSAFQALRRWTAAGQTLCVWDVSPEVRDSDLPQLLGLPVESGDGPGNWMVPDVGDLGTGFADAENLFRNQLGMTGIVPVNPAIMPPRFRTRSYQLGRVVAMEADDPFVDRHQLEWMLNSLSPLQWAWFQRYGMSLNRSNPDFSDWLIPGVGEPPVILFLVLLSGFVVLIGPVNYFTLRRSKRLYLLLVTVPAAAFITTTILLAFGILSDGFGVRVRARSFTLLDPSSGEHVTWSRQSYYAGLQPSGGLAFDDNTTVLPLDPQPKEWYGRIHPEYRVDWTRGQGLVSGYLRARETAQFLAIQVAPQPIRLTLEPRGEKLEVHNELGAPVQLLVACDAAGKWFMTRGIAAGASATLEAVDLPAVQLALNSGIPERTATRAMYSNYWSQIDTELSAPTVGTSVLEQQLTRIRFANVAPGTFVALLAGAEWLPRGVDEVEWVGSVHAVEGRWSGKSGSGATQRPGNSSSPSSQSSDKER